MAERQRRTSRKSFLDGVRALTGKRKPRLTKRAAEAEVEAEDEEELLVSLDEALETEIEELISAATVEVQTESAEDAAAAAAARNAILAGAISTPGGEVESGRVSKQSEVDRVKNKDEKCCHDKICCVKSSDVLPERPGSSSRTVLAEISPENFDFFYGRDEKRETHSSPAAGEISQGRGHGHGVDEGQLPVVDKEDQNDEIPLINPSYGKEKSKIFRIRKKTKLNKKKRKGQGEKAEQLEVTLEDEEVTCLACASDSGDPEKIEIIGKDPEEKKNEKRKKRRKKAKRIVKKAGVTVWKGMKEGWRMVWSGLSMYTLPLGLLDVSTTITRTWSVYAAGNK